MMQLNPLGHGPRAAWPTNDRPLVAVLDIGKTNVKLALVEGGAVPGREAPFL